MLEERQWSKVEELFGALVDLPEAEREELLAELCGGDDELEEEVRSLLTADQRGAALLPEPKPPAPDLPRGRRLGPYRVLRLLGHGGTGTVYLAERDDDVCRRAVAVKVVAEDRTRAHAVARFLAERRILAALDHPNIVRLLDGGRTADGLLYLVMDYVEGEPIDRYCDRHRLPIAERVALVRAVCRAVHAAHQLLVVHRDIKPGNVLVTARGEPKLLDFGIAKPLPAAWPDAARSTAAGLRPMTPEYASPEQVQGARVGTASDVYALGVLLYRLLAGHSPYRPQGSGAGALERAICEQEPERPSVAALRDPGSETRARDRGTSPAGLRRQLAGDLDAIVLKALRKEPAHRYASAERLSADLGRHHRGQPVHARRGSLAYSARKLLRRHWPAATAACAVLVMLVVFAAAMAMQAARLASERDRAADERDKARRVATFLGEIFELADPETSLAETVTAREILDRGADRIPVEFGDRPVLQAELLHTVGTIYTKLGLYRRAGELIERALTARRSVLGPEHLTVAESLDQLGEIRYLEGDYAASERFHSRAAELFRRGAGSDDLRFAGATQNLAVALRRQNRLEEAERLYRQALEIYHRGGADEHPEAARALSNLAVLLHRQGDLAEAERLHRRALALRRRVLGPRHPDVARSLSYLGMTLRDLGAAQEAEALMRQALDLHVALWGRDHPEVGWAHHDLATLLRGQGDLAGAEEHVRQALEIQRLRLGEGHPDLAGTTNELALILIERGDLAGAEGSLAKVLEIYRGTLGDDHPYFAIALGNLARVAALGGDRERAERHYRRALAVLERADGSEQYEATAALRLGVLLLDAGEADAAEPVLRRAVDAFDRVPAPPPDARAWAENTLGACLTALGRYEEAERALLTTYPALRQDRGADADRDAQAVHRLVALYRAWGRPEDAARWEHQRAALDTAGG